MPSLAKSTFALAATQTDRATTFTPTNPATFPSNFALCLAISVIFLVVIVARSHRAQAYFTYYHWLNPPTSLFPPSKLQLWGLANSARQITHLHLCGWHLVPPGPPFLLPNDTNFDALLKRPAQRVIIFFHGASGSRAFPTRRVNLMRLLSSQFDAHVIAFDYSGFADSGSQPSEIAIFSDARNVYDWVKGRVEDDTDLIVYGQSLGTFPAIHLAAHVTDLCIGSPRSGADIVILDAAPASLQTLAMSHPVGIPLRIFPHRHRLLQRFLKEKLDSEASMCKVRIPVLLLHGENDYMVPVDHARRLCHAGIQGGNKNVDLLVLKDCGHSDVNAAAEFPVALDRFFAKHLRNYPIDVT